MTPEHEATQLLERLVRISSTSGNEADASACLVEWMAERGMDARIDEAGNAVGIRGNGAREVLLLGHIDTFPGTVPVRREGNLLYGRGSVDAKGPLCTFAAAAAALEPGADWRVTVVGAVEEEAASSRGARHVLAQRLVDAPAYCVIGEPSRWDRITLGYKGRLVLEVDLRTPLAHSAGNQRLPAERGIDLWHVVESFCAERDKARDATRPFDRVSPALQDIASVSEGTHGRVRLTIGFRLPPSEDPETLQSDLETLLRREISDDGVTATTRFAGAEYAHKAHKSTPLVRAFLAAIRETKGQPRFVVKTGTSDMNVVAPSWPSTPFVAYGPGDSGLDHTPDEHVDIEEYLQSITVLQRVLQQLTGA